MTALATRGGAPGGGGASAGGSLREAVRRRGWAHAAAVVLALFVLVGLIGELTPAPQGPAGSSYATTARGAAAWAQLLSQDGHPVSRLRRPLSLARLPASETLIVIGAHSLGASASARLRAFATGGGRLVLAGAAGPAVAAVLGATGSPVRPGGLEVRRLGAGRVVTLQDASLVENAHLDEGDNALVALRAAGPRGRPVAFAEALHGYTAATGLSAFPARWWVTIAGLALAAGAWALARGRRLGPAEPSGPAPVPPRAAYVDAMARALTARPPRLRRPGSEAPK